MSLIYKELTLKEIKQMQNNKAKKEYWCIVLNNFEGKDDKIFFENYYIARENYLNLIENHRDCDEFQAAEKNKCSWFDPYYNEWSTFVTLEKQPLPLYNEVIF